MINILRFIDALRETDAYIKEIYRWGGCYRFHLLLKELYPEAEGYVRYTHGGHVITKIRDNFYDINGLVTDLADYQPIKKQDEDHLQHWSFSGYNYIKIRDCPHCGEDIIH